MQNGMTILIILFFKRIPKITIIWNNIKSTKSIENL